MTSLTSFMIHQIANAGPLYVVTEEPRRVRSCTVKSRGVQHRVIDGKKFCKGCGQTLDVKKHFKIARYHHETGKVLYRGMCIDCEKVKK